MESGIKGTECDYALAFKLSVVEQIEKASSATRKHSGRCLRLQVKFRPIS